GGGVSAEHLERSAQDARCPAGRAAAPCTARVARTGLGFDAPLPSVYPPEREGPWPHPRTRCGKGALVDAVRGHHAGRLPAASQPPGPFRAPLADDRLRPLEKAAQAIPAHAFSVLPLRFD